jgi:hypothetical protein
MCLRGERGRWGWERYHLRQSLHGVPSRQMLYQRARPDDVRGTDDRQGADDPVRLPWRSATIHRRDNQGGLQRRHRDCHAYHLVGYGNGGLARMDVAWLRGDPWRRKADVHRGPSRTFQLFWVLGMSYYTPDLRVCTYARCPDDAFAQVPGEF